MWIPQCISHQNSNDENQIENLFINNKILVEIRKGMYGLPQAGQLAYISLIKHLKLYGYTCTDFIPDLFKHATQDTLFSLVFYDFGVKYKAKNDELHLIDTPKKKYLGITIYWNDRIFLGIHLYWDYTKRTVTLSTPNYVKKSLLRFQYIKPKHDQHSPHPHATTNYGTKIQ